jgi:hypothetical protein
LAQAFKVLISSSSLSALACTSAWVGGLETARPRAGVLSTLNPQPSTNLVNWPRILPEDSGKLSAGKLGSRVGVDISKLWFVSPLFYARPPAGTSRETRNRETTVGDWP